jgi:hypothetical protein
MGYTHGDMNLEDWVKTQSLVLRMGQIGCLYLEKEQRQTQTLAFHFI